jgi:DNA mismatch repair protein MLH3
MISQIDHKFILASLPQAEQGNTARDSLVMIDQHAADERCKLEYLLSELCTSPGADSISFVSTLGLKSKINFVVLSSPLEYRLPPHEARHFMTQAARFADWGILYDIEPPLDPTPSASQRHRLVVRTLPPTVAERLTMEPDLLINILRTEVWKNAGSGRSAARIDTEMIGCDDVRHPWLRRIGTCPTGILDLLSSRACRSAVMFNDPLTAAECGALIENLATCAFPFQCAHGRPSMVPVIRIEEDGDGRGTLGLFDCSGGVADTEYANAFRSWKQSKE